LSIHPLIYVIDPPERSLDIGAIAPRREGAPSRLRALVA
jgi:hypothetical protein